MDTTGTGTLGEKSPAIDPARCTGCGRCVAACRSGLYTLNLVGNRKVSTRVTPDLCSLCGSCIRECLLGAISPLSRDTDIS